MIAARRCDLETRWQEVRGERERNAYHLARRGSLVAKWASGGRRWVLRFSAPDSQGRMVHRSLYLGSDDAPEVLRRARALLRHYREEADGLKEICLFARLVAKAAAVLDRRPSRSRGAGRPRGDGHQSSSGHL